MLIVMENETGEIIGAGIAGAPGLLKSLTGEDSKLLAKVRRARAKLKVGASADPMDLDGADDAAKIRVAAMDGRLAGIERDLVAGRGAPMHKSMSELLHELRQLGGGQVSEPLRKSFAPAATVPQLGMLVTASSPARRGVVLKD